MQALQTGSYRWLSAGDILEMGSAARVGALGEGHRHTAKERPLNAGHDVPPLCHILGIFRSRLVPRGAGGWRELGAVAQCSCAVPKGKGSCLSSSSGLQRSLAEWLKC